MTSPTPARVTDGVARTELTEGWTLTVTDGPAPCTIRDVPATVPGTMMTDLLDAGLIPDPYLDRNEHELAWTGECDALYRTRFTWAPAGADRVDLVAASLDTVATVVLNGHEIARTRNQHRSWRFDVTDVIREGDNDLEIRFAAPLRAAREAAEVLGDLPNAGNDHPYNAIRKMACNFGWDWGPVLLTSGIAGPIAIEEWSGARLDRPRPHVVLDEDGSGLVEVRVGIERASGGDRPLALRLTVCDEDGELLAQSDIDVCEDGAVVSARVQEPRLWWPRGYGDQPLCTARVELRAADGTVLDARERRVGFRTAGVVEKHDEIGTSFTVVVNGRSILAKGANWIPDDCFPTRLTAEDYRRGVADATEAGMNMLRIWGGGLYEAEELYDLCDEQGILVWQDFALACAAYSEREPLRSEIEEEAREQIVRLAWHPSLVHWNGSNENVEGYHMWGWKDTIPAGTGWGDGYYTELLPALLAELDPTRSYTPSSPYSRPVPEDPHDPDHGTIHNWEVWNRVDYTHYRDTVARFSAEFGFQGPACWATIERAITERPLDADSPTMLAHQKAEGGQDKLRAGFAPHFPEPTSFEDFHATTQLNQAHALACGIGHYRSHWPTCTGTIVWQLNDCWPVTSWAAVDGDGRRKLLWHALAAVYAPVLLTFEPRGASAPDGGASAASWIVAIGNDTDEPLASELRIRRLTLEGEQLAEHREAVRVAPRASAAQTVPAALLPSPDPAAAAREVVVAELIGRAERALHWGAEVRDSGLAPQAEALEAAAEREDDEHVVVTLTARSAVRDACILADRAHPDAVSERQLVSLLPGESARIRVCAPGEVEPGALCDPRVLVTANGLLERGLRTELVRDAAPPAGYAGPQVATGP